MKQQLILPCIPVGASQINYRIGVWRDDDSWAYFMGGHPIYSHGADDRRMLFLLVPYRLIFCYFCKKSICLKVIIPRKGELYGVPLR
jgi:hypothetical protein